MMRLVAGIVLAYYLVGLCACGWPDDGWRGIKRGMETIGFCLYLLTVWPVLVVRERLKPTKGDRAQNAKEGK